MASDSSCPPLLRKLLTLLEKPKSLKIAERMVKSWTDRRNRLAAVDYQTNHTCLCSMIMSARLPQRFVCQSFHWNCILDYLAMETIESHNGELSSSTRFASLSGHVQVQFLTLLIQIHKSVPAHLVQKFVNRTKVEDEWTGFLFRKLTLLVSPYQQPQTSEVTALTSQTIDRIAEICHKSCTNQSPKLAVRPVDSISCATVHQKTSGKRKRGESQEPVEEKQVKRVKLPEHITVDEDLVVVSDEMHVGPSSAATAVNILPANIQLAIDSIKMMWSKGQKAPSDEFQKIVSLPSQEFNDCLSLLVIENLSDSKLVAITQNIIELDVDTSFQYQVSCLQHLITPHFTALQKPVSRTIHTSLVSIISRFPLASVNGLLYPVLLSAQFSGCQGDFMCKLIKEALTDEQRNHLCRTLASTSRKTNGEPFLWNEHLIKVWQFLIEKGICLDESCVENLLKLLQVNAGYHVASLKFANLLMKLVTKHSSELVTQQSVLFKIVNSNKTSLRDKLLSLIQNL